MTEQTIAKKKDPKKYGLKNVSARWKLDGKTLQKLTLEKRLGTETENGTLCVNTGKFTGRSPKDRFPSDPGHSWKILFSRKAPKNM